MQVGEGLAVVFVWIGMEDGQPVWSWQSESLAVIYY